MPGHGYNAIFFNKKIKDWTPRTLANPQDRYVRYYLIFALPLSPPSQSGRHMCITAYLHIQPEQERPENQRPEKVRILFTL